MHEIYFYRHPAHQQYVETFHMVLIILYSLHLILQTATAWEICRNLLYDSTNTVYMKFTFADTLAIASMYKH